DVAALGKLRQAAGEGRNDLLLAGTNLVDVNLVNGNIDPPFRRKLVCLFDHLGDVEQGLRRDAAAQQASAAEALIGLDQHDLHPLVCCQKGGRISSRTAAKNNQLGMHCYETRLECKGLACRSLLAIAQVDQGPRVERTACLTVKTPRRWKGHSGSMPAVRPPPAPVG